MDHELNIDSRQRKGGPTLNWYEVQPVVFSAEGDVLLVLDYCYAAQAARGRESRTIELLAASGVKQRTPPPGESSFTAVLMKVMKRMLEKDGHVVVHKLYKNLFKETDPDEELVEQPFHFFIAEGGGSIVLKPRQKPDSLDQTQDIWPSALLSLTVSLSQKPDRSTMRRLAVWLKTAVPRTISSVDVERVLLRTETIQEFLLARRDSGLRTAIKPDFGQSEQNERVGLISPLSRARAPLQGTQNEAEDVLFALKVWNDQVYQSMERHLLLDPGFVSHSNLTQLESDESAQALGLDKAARLRMLNMEGISEPELYDPPALPYGTVKIEPAATSDHPIAVGEANRGIATGNIGNDPVWVEFFPYESQSDQARTSAKVKRLAALFLQARSSAFLVAPFLGYIHEPVKSRFGLVFRASRGKEPSLTPRHMTLHSAMSQRRLMPLNRRMGLAFALSRAISALHAVGWVHKSFCSENVVLPYISDDMSSGKPDAKDPESSVLPPDLDDPQLFGFEAARPRDAISSQTREFRLSRLLYTHPERWGRPGVIFGALHDIYALGVTLLEVGCWKPASRMDRRGRAFSDRRNENEVRGDLLAVAREQLPHLTGESYSQAVIACLDGSLADGLEEGSEGLGLHQALGKRVLIPLGRCTYA